MSTSTPTKGGFLAEKEKAQKIQQKYSKYRAEHEEAYEDEGAKQRHQCQSPRTSQAMGTREIVASPFIDKTQAAVMNAQKAYRRASRRRERRRRKRERKMSQSHAEETVSAPTNDDGGDNDGNGDDDHRHPAQSPRQEGAAKQFWNDKPDLTNQNLVNDDSDTDLSPNTPCSPHQMRRANAQSPKQNKPSKMRRGSSSPQSPRGGHVSADDIFKQKVPNLKLKNVRDKIRSSRAKTGNPSTPKANPHMSALIEEGRKHIRSFQPPKLNLTPAPRAKENGKIRHPCQSPAAGGLTPRSSNVFKFKNTVKKKPLLSELAEGGLELDKYQGVDQDGFERAGKRNRRRHKMGAFQNQNNHDEEEWVKVEGGDADGDDGDGGDGDGDGGDGGVDEVAEPLTPMSKSARRRRRKKTMEENL